MSDTYRNFTRKDGKLDHVDMTELDKQVASDQNYRGLIEELKHLKPQQQIELLRELVQENRRQEQPTAQNQDKKEWENNAGPGEGHNLLFVDQLIKDKTKNEGDPRPFMEREYELHTNSKAHQWNPTSPWLPSHSDETAIVRLYESDRNGTKPTEISAAEFKNRQGTSEDPELTFFRETGHHIYSWTPENKAKHIKQGWNQVDE